MAARNIADFFENSQHFNGHTSNCDFPSTIIFVGSVNFSAKFVVLSHFLVKHFVVVCSTFNQYNYERK